MKIKVRFTHSKKAKTFTMSPATFFLGKGCSTGPVLCKGEKSEFAVEVCDGDTLEFSTTQFYDEFDFGHFRRGKQLNLAKPRTKKLKVEIEPIRASELTPKGRALLAKLRKSGGDLKTAVVK